LTVQTAAYWSNAAGAGVFTAGTMDWPRELTVPGVGATLTTITDNVLIAFAQPHAGRLQPAGRPGGGATGHVEAEVR
jgi:hypothetical protein